MENNKIENKSEKCEKTACCKYHHVMAPLIVIVLLIVVFAIGLSVGHRFGGRDYRGAGGFERGGCMGRVLKGRDSKTCPRNLIPAQNLGNTNTNTDLTATSSLSE